ncbi:MAG: glycosyltransferase family 4 protein [Bacteroidetes bacterium]|nr:glycosyltransferase family 4 protein [Bacteroidota bacterium]
MKIAVNTRLLLSGRLDGIGRFADETLRIITSRHPEHQFIFYFDRKFDPQFIYNSNITPVVIGPPARHPLLFLGWFEVSLPWHFRRSKPDLFLSPEGYLSLSSPVKQVGVIHDLNFEHHPEDLPWVVKQYFTRMYPRFALKATRIATVSEYSKADIAKTYRINPSKIDVVYNGAGQIFAPLDEESKKQVRQKYSRGSDYFFFIGTLHPRKNLVNLFRSFDLFKENDSKGIKLVMAGAKMWWTEEIRLAYETMNHRDDVIFTGRVSDEELAALMSSALALTYVSYFEGFGIPILEAFYCDTPVITSNITSMPEVAGEAALLVDPFSVDSIAVAMTKLTDDPVFRDKLIDAGRQQRQKFSWEKTADKLWQCLERAAKGSQHH